jgi:hypothetical protein
MRSSGRLVRSISGYIVRQAAWAYARQIACGVVNLFGEADRNISGSRDPPQTCGYDACSSVHQRIFSIIYIMRQLGVSAI